MAIDKFKEISLSPPSERMSVETAYQLIDSIYAELYEKTIIPAFNTFLKLCELYSAKSFADSRKKQADLLRLIEAHRVAATNKLGEYEEGLSIFDRVKQILQKISQLPQDNLTIDYFNSVIAASDDMSTDALYSVAELAFYSLFASSADIFSDSDKWYNRYIYDLTQVFFRSYEIKSDKLDPSKAIPSLEFLPSAPVMPMGAVEKLSESLHFSALFEEFLAHKISNNNLSLDSQREYQNYFSVVLHFIGDLPVDTITKRQIKECLTRYGTLGLRNRKPYNTMDFVEFVAATVPEVDRVSSKTVGEVRRMLQGIFRYALDRDYIGQSPAQDLNMDFEKTNSRGAYSKAQINTLLQGVESFCGKNEWKKWVIRLGVYTGVRAGELAQLRVEDIKVDDDSGVRYLLITGKAGRIKTDNALRQVPLHSELIRMGFLDYVASQKIKVFPDIKSSAKISKWFPSYRESVGVPAETDFEESLVFHSFRHSMVTYLRGRGANDAQVQQIVGHEKTGAGITDRYTQRIPIADLKEVIERFTVSSDARGE